MNPSLPLSRQEILVLVGGGISAYKSVTLVRELQRLGAQCEIVLTHAACKFISPVTFAAVTSRAPRIELWDPSFPGELHIELTRRTHATVVAPATADLMARAAHGLADDLATACLLCAQSPVFMAPAMHPRMWNHPATQANVRSLASRGVNILGPATGALASGEEGIGRMLEPESIASSISTVLATPRDLEGLRILISAGPTYEAIDPVRFIGNRSSGRMGFALAERARDRGAKVTLVSGPVSLEAPAGVEIVRVQSASQMRDAVVPRAEENDVVIMAAAVADYRPENISQAKIKKSDGSLSLNLVKNPDILQELGLSRGEARTPVLVGFAVETHELLGYARDKLSRKRCDLVVANLAEHAFEGTDNTVVLVRKDRIDPLERMSKHQVADAILDAVKELRTT